jgi:thiosulfate/3-mercaptopyruvate sulfurtransferase
MMDDLVTTEWLADQLGAPDLRLLDASWYLPEHGRDAAAGYAAAHIPGAVRFDLDAISDGTSSLPHMLPSEAQFGAAMEAMGVGLHDRIIVYDDSPLHSGARAWWMLRSMGAPAVALLDGGLAKWRSEGRVLSTGVEALLPGSFPAHLNRTGVRTLYQMRHPSEQIVDARSPSRFAGAEPEPRPGVTPGHIPGSLNLHYPRLFRTDGTWKRGDELASAFRDAGVDLDRPIVTTCGSGVTAAVLLFGLHLLGREGALYDGSWAEWGSHADTPKATA